MLLRSSGPAARLPHARGSWRCPSWQLHCVGARGIQCHALSFRAETYAPPAAKVEHAAATLINRGTANPFEAAGQWLHSKVVQLDVVMASAGVHSPAVTALMALATGAAAVLGLHSLQVLVAGAPLTVVAWVEDLVGLSLAALPVNLLLLAATPLALWHALVWWSLHAALARSTQQGLSFLALLLLPHLPAWGRACLGACLAAALWAAQQQPALQQRLAPLTVQAGDTVWVHVTVLLHNGVAAVVVMLPGVSLRELGQEVVTAALMNSVSKLRFKRLAAVLDEMVEGALQGEVVETLINNPPPEKGGFFNPDLLWWQSLEDVMKKFRGEMPELGAVFLYPILDPRDRRPAVGPAAGLQPSGEQGRKRFWVPVQVTAIGKDFVELDGNYALSDQPVTLSVEVVGLQKQ
ncbi:hypothetical protein V8C86DRAFT_2442831 [Haematococcus lacustris]